MSASLPLLVVSSGEPAGIGPDIALALAPTAWPTRLAILADITLLADRARAIGASVKLKPCNDARAIGRHEPGVLHVLPIALRAPVEAGKLNEANAAYVLEMLRNGTELCLSGEAHALITAPVQKSVITRSGVAFSGHTEFLAELTGAALPVMLLANDRVRVALATTHLPLRDVPSALSHDLLENVLRILHTDLERLFKIEKPRILVLGLNPHAGESGTLGTEEIDIITPVIRKLTAEGLRIVGPASADTAFTEDSRKRCDAILAMYHDQGLPALKGLAFGEIVNVTLGLPIVRTSVDHGTALDLAGTGRARADSLFAALRMAHELVRS